MTTRRSLELLGVALNDAEIATTRAGVEPAEASDCFVVYRRELDYLIGTLRRLGTPASDIDDVLHEIFLVLLRRFQDYDRARPLKPWLFGIAFWVASDHRRRNKRELLSDGYDMEDSAARPDDLVAAAQGRRLLLKALASVPLKRRAVLIMHDIDEVTMREIARELAIPLFTAYSRLRKARRELDAALKQLLKGESHAP